MSVGTLIYSQTPRNLMIDSITKGSRPLFVTNRLYITREGEGEEKGEGRCFINFIFRPKCYFLAARKGVRRGTVERRKEAKERKRGMARLGQRGIKAGAPSLYAIYDTFFKRANIRQRGNNCTGHYDAP